MRIYLEFIALTVSRKILSFKVLLDHGSLYNTTSVEANFLSPF